MRAAILWTHLSGYLNSCLRELSQLDGTKLFVSHLVSDGSAPYDSKEFAWISSRKEWPTHIDQADLLKSLEEFRPDALLVSSWHIPEYRHVLSHFKGKAIRVLAMDNPWLATPKQWLGVLTARWYLHPLYDAAFVPGNRQKKFAQKLGFDDENIWPGLLSCDHDAYTSVKHTDSAQAFIYTGRLAPEKGIDVLAEGYQIYRDQNPNPWPLLCCGTGPLEKNLRGIQGIELKGFVQPKDLPSEMSRASCLVLPSLFEPWGVAIHEATSAGLAVICSAACGASDHLVQDGKSGFIVGTGKARDLAAAMTKFTSLSQQERNEMSKVSRTLAAQFTPRKWAQTFYENVLKPLK